MQGFVTKKAIILTAFVFYLLFASSRILRSLNFLGAICSSDNAWKSSNIHLSVVDISGYSKLVSNIEDPDYNDVAVDFPVWPITGADQLVGQLSSNPWLLVWNPWIITITTLWELRRTSGSWWAEFYFKVFHRNSLWVETEIAVSNYTLSITNSVYAQFNTSALLNNWPFTATDRIVIKYYATRISGGSNPSYEMLFWWENPTRTLFPVPTSVVLNDYYTKTETNNLLDTKADKDRWHYIGKVFYTGNDTTIAWWEVSECEYEATTIYRYVTNTNDTNWYPTQDAFYWAFDWVNLTSLITTRW